RRWCCHGKAEVPGVPAGDQTRMALAAVEALGIARGVRALLPVVCLRGSLHGRPKLTGGQ
ncbi:MAG TPA: hypothetical protein VD902_04625, partial [Symbiobacteriaceae bacterium]|nr:hypothetical protein [Symbiobacteriaceae bacterium]